MMSVAATLDWMEESAKTNGVVFTPFGEKALRCERTGAGLKVRWIRSYPAKGDMPGSQWEVTRSEAAQFLRVELAANRLVLA
ncbi:hypothetical protein PQQ75_04170 [Paraburkholderia aspalathi]|uniref:hypothetical protein n=1 Tax=Paraburkholderia aspalathi TaxID=1324617 RepID=UPI0038BD9DE9